MQTGSRDDAVVSIVFVGKPKDFVDGDPANCTRRREALKFGGYSDVSSHFPVVLFCERAVKLMIAISSYC